MENNNADPIPTTKRADEKETDLSLVPLKPNDFEPRFTINPERRKFAYIAGILLGLLILSLWYVVLVGHIIATSSLSGSCNATVGNMVRDSAIAYEYGLNPGNWGNLSNYMNSTCRSYDSYVAHAIANSTEHGLNLT